MVGSFGSQPHGDRAFERHTRPDPRRYEITATPCISSSIRALCAPRKVPSRNQGRSRHVERAVTTVRRIPTRRLRVRELDRRPSLQWQFALALAAATSAVASCASDSADGSTTTSAAAQAATASISSPVVSTSPTTAPVGSPATSAGDVVELPGAVSCSVNYRPTAETLDGSVDQIVVAARVDGFVDETPVDAVFDNMTFRVRYAGDEFEGYAVSASVIDGDQVVLNVLYQLGGTSLADVDFAGGSGFTGLHYVSHDGSLLQFWCSA